MSKWKKAIDAFFGMHAKERKAVWQLASVSAVVILLLSLKTYFHQPPQSDPETLAFFEAKIENWKLQKLEKAESDLAILAEAEKDPVKAVSFFDPNSLDDAGWLELGLSEKQLKTLRNYQATGAVFKSLNDLRKVYSLGDSFVDRYGQYVRFQDKQVERNQTSEFTSKEKITKETNHPPKPVENKPLIKVDINSIDSVGLVELKGIGPFYARQIIRTRNELGGFYSLQQLEEVWKMRPETMEVLKAHAVIETQPNCLDVNLAKAEELAKHPYIDWKLAHSVVAFREAHGAFKSEADFRKLHLLQDSTWLKLQPYLCLHGSN